MSNYIHFIGQKTEAAVLFRNNAKNCLLDACQREGLLNTGFEDQGHHISLWKCHLLNLPHSLWYSSVSFSEPIVLLSSTVSPQASGCYLKGRKEGNRGGRINF